MKCYYDRNYGADRDGNRGVGVWDCELEKSDEPEILEQLYNRLQDETDTESVRELPTCVVTMINPYNDYDVEFEITPSEFISQKEWDEFRVKGMDDVFEVLPTPREFLNMMQSEKSGDIEVAHGNMDDLMVKLLRTLGYGDAMDVFEMQDKWYA